MRKSHSTEIFQLLVTMSPYQLYTVLLTSLQSKF